MQQRHQQHKLHSGSPGVWLRYIISSDEALCDRDSTFIVLIFECDTADNVANAASYMNQRPFLAQRKTRCNRKRQPYGFREQGSPTEIAMDNKTCKGKLDCVKAMISIKYRHFTRHNSFDFWDATACSLCKTTELAKK